MDSLFLLVFDLDGERFGVDATRVRESVWLPELTPVEEAPPWVVGVFSLRGQIVPVADLNLRFGHPARAYRPGDRVVVLESGPVPLGLIVSDVIEVIELPLEAIQPPPRFDAAAPGPAHLVAGEARVGDGLVAVLDVSRLTALAEAPAPGESLQRQAPAAHFCPEATAAERALFHARAVALREAALEEEDNRIGLAVVEIDGECFGVELAAVREFCNVRQLSPIPCCPPHILGAISLRGDLLTLVDPRAALNLPAAGKSGGKAVIGALGEQAVGIAVDEVHDVVYLRADELQPPPPALRERHGAEVIGTAPHAGRTMTVLDLPALLRREEWIVNETV
ncbi:MAG: chemotaxis protein CheW [Rhodocyclaceae bacterium]|nr:chemotaxis protein CheW [Rhodocyclaceae bacterium]